MSNQTGHSGSCADHMGMSCTAHVKELQLNTPVTRRQLIDFCHFLTSDGDGDGDLDRVYSKIAGRLAAAIGVHHCSRCNSFGGTPSKVSTACAVCDPREG